jgi:hypothetical protein
MDNKRVVVVVVVVVCEHSGGKLMRFDYKLESFSG